MSTPTETPNPESTVVTEEKPSEETTETASTETESTEEKPEGETPETKQEDDLPEWAKKELTKTRGEAANYRVKLREAEGALKNAKTVEEFEAARAEFSNKIAELETALMKEKVARKYELPDELAARLQGADEASLEADAKALQKFVTPAVPESLGGGLTPDDGEDDFDPVKAAQAARRKGY
ncbi:head scaffolding protein [Streptomyces phage Aaronocolus]|uniref:Scaffolding protein n=10 Tax=Likavirus TaxID=1982880 RepID=A0A411CVC1_9CAUD|nr:head scaffolding protein [Streptomyces phage Caliburn]YP_009616434.1 head scaffolding protein [Streptomyces phage Aaronocolus]YP_009616509.1 head scaffolding protein [Streptomyces phage Hydra]ATE84888.1 scaffolding protein [Streptomyces phage BeardedLady]ATE85189.1 scaffolding protein [Streptomyces phage Esperer]ATE85414.1 scaffolding protein [Streptomyces phage Ozzie]QAY17212.1 scaffolding protein [Streptomyces phage Bovely]QAY17285.1 scaffolding protein [Streptomyces phage Indigo]QAY17